MVHRFFNERLRLNGHLFCAVCRSKLEVFWRFRVEKLHETDLNNAIELFFSFGLVCLSVAENYYGTHIARLSELHHSVTGNVFAVDSRTIFIKDFTYDGEGPAAYFYVGASKTPSNTGGFRIRDERGSSGVLKKYIKKDIVLTLPEGKTLRDIKWFAVWCDEFSVNFGSVTIPKNFEFPRPQKIGGLKGIHAVQSDNIVIVDAQTLLIPNFSYDGAAPGKFFFLMPQLLSRKRE